MPQILDVQKLRLLDEPDTPPIDRVLDCDLLIAGGGMGGCAAALAACRAGKTVVLTEETDWLGGQMTSQGVSALDEHRYIESFSGTRSYYELRETIRSYYRENATLTEEARSARALNPGNGWVSHLCFEPRAGLWALEELLTPFVEAEKLIILIRHQAVSAQVEGDSVRAVIFRELDGDSHVEVRSRYVLDATELGDLLPLTGTEYVTGAESAQETGEPNAVEGAARPEWTQSFTYPFVLEYRPGERHSIACPPEYAEDRERQPFTLKHLYYDERGWITYRMFEGTKGAGGPFWTYRRLVDATNFDDPRYAHDLAMINWPGNDFRHGPLIDVSAETALQSLRRAKQLSLGFCYWLQNECPRDEGGTAYPEMHLRPDLMGTADGLSKYPYIRESRRIRAVRTVAEQDIAASHQPGARARHFPDSVGIGFYAIDIHPGEGEEKIPPAQTRPFQIPLSSLVPVRMRNLLPACKNIGTTHITNGAYRLHPIEWNIGESAALLAVFCIDHDLTPHAVLEDPRRVRRFQRWLVRSGVPIYWYPDLSSDHPVYEAAQVLGGWGIWAGNRDLLEFQPERVVGSAELQSLVESADWGRDRLQSFLEVWLPRWGGTDRGTLFQAVYAALSG